jgi:hypothetical protein
MEDTGNIFTTLLLRTMKNLAEVTLDRQLKLSQQNGSRSHHVVNF